MAVVENPIESLTVEANHDSSGCFTLEPRVAFQKLRNHLLQPEDCLLYLLQSAVASGASELEVRTGPAEVTVYHDGFFPSPEEVPQVLAWALEGVTDRQQVSRHRLALALASTLAPPGRGLCFDYPDGTSLEWRSGKEPLLLPKHKHPAYRCQLRLPLAHSWWRRLSGIYETPGVQRLRQRGRYAPLRLRIDSEPYFERIFGRELRAYFVMSDGTTQLGGGENDPVYYSDHHAAEFRVHSSSPPRMDLSNCSYASWLLGEPRKRGESCWAALGWRLNGSPGRLEVIQYGVSLGSESTGRLPDPLWMLLADDEVATDVSCLKLLPDDQLWLKVEDLRSRFNLAFQPVREKFALSGSRRSLEAWLVEHPPKRD